VNKIAPARRKAARNLFNIRRVASSASWNIFVRRYAARNLIPSSQLFPEGPDQAMGRPFRHSQCRKGARVMAENLTNRDDKFARESFTFRRMTPWQLWSISIAAAVVIVVALAYAMSM
jgi:hypothetical protein